MRVSEFVTRRVRAHAVALLHRFPAANRERRPSTVAQRTDRYGPTMDELDDQLAQDLVAALTDLKASTAEVEAARLRGGPPFERARAREEKAIERIRDLAQRPGGARERRR
jgi:hypothetical protein